MTTETTTTEIDAWRAQQERLNYELALAAAAQPYEHYGFYQTAGFTPAQLQAFGMADQFVAANPGEAQLNQALRGIGGLPTGTAAVGADQFTEAAALMGRAGGSILDQDLAAYMNPYTTQVIQQAEADLERTRRINQLANQDRAAQAAAFGGSRHGVVEAETNRAFADAAARNAANLRAQAFESGMGLAQSDLGRALEAGQQLGNLGYRQRQLSQQDLQTQMERNAVLADLGLAVRQFDLENINLMRELGGQQQVLDQQRQDIAYRDFLEERDWPLRALNIRTSTLGNQPMGSTTTMGVEQNDWLSAIGGAGAGFEFGRQFFEDQGWDPQTGGIIGSIFGGMGGGGLF